LFNLVTSVTTSHPSPFVSQKGKKIREFKYRNGKIQSDLKKGDTEEVTLNDLARTLSQEKHDYEKSYFTTK